MRRALEAIDRLPDRRAVVAMVAVGLLLALPGLLLAGEPNSDGLFYEVQAKELQGESHAVAMHDVFDSAQARRTAEIEDAPSGSYRVLNSAWQRFSARFYERRWLVPGLAILVGAVTGEGVPTALKTVSMLGYALIGAALFLLLRRRFRVSVSLLGALGCMLAPSLYRWSFGQFVDSWGVLLESLGLLALVIVVDRGLRWLPLWIGAMLALSVTRDATMILGLAALWLTVCQLRDRAARRRNVWILASGAAAAAPALLLGGAPLRENLAYILANYNVPTDMSWGHVLAGYPGQLWATVQGDATYPLSHGAAGPLLYGMLAIAIAAIVLVVARRPRGDAFWLVQRGAILGCIVLLLIANNPQGYRLELVFVPTIAAGLAIAFSRLADFVTRASQPRPAATPPCESPPAR
ncbi:MAG TPA: hypothetical protein VHQ43_00085 [Solirubrobacterales bacterium]|jgi:hypothetical protein|nr:hypothetical protein [Solirubrobacterales bacterium]